MKTKRILMIILIVAVLAVAFVLLYLFWSVVDQPNIEDVSPARWKQVKQSYVDMKRSNGYPDSLTIESVFVVEYCGSYKGSIVVMLSDDQTLYTAAIRTVVVADQQVTYSNSNELLVWNDGELYTLDQAYSAGLITKSNVKSICSIHNKNS